MRYKLFIGAVVFAMSFATGSPAVGQVATPAVPAQPVQPATGPGGADYLFDEVIARHFGPEPDGSADPDGYWLFEPAVPLANVRVGAVPLILFFHGYYGTDPSHYRAWIDHLVRRGAVVLYPDYQPLEEPLLAECPQVCSEEALPTLPNALAAIRAGLAELQSAEHVPVDLTKVGATGHSWGGMLSAKYAAIAETEGLPVPSAIMPAMPGCECDFAGQVGTVPDETLVIMLTGRQDLVVLDMFARQMWNAMEQVPLDNRDFVRLTVDNHGEPPLVADHGTPATDGEWGPLDAYDWYGTWKFFDALLACGFDDAGCDVALGNTPEQRFMGAWSDGTPVVEAEITKDP